MTLPLLLEVSRNVSSKVQSSISEAFSSLYCLVVEIDQNGSSIANKKVVLAYVSVLYSQLVQF